ncbi:MAG: sulfite exporter TauE/SafE family protein [Fibrobacterota bacterium]
MRSNFAPPCTMTAELLSLFGIGLLAGFINVMAGGGSALNMGLLIAMGLDSRVANGTNRLSILTGAFSSTTTFLRKGIITGKELLPFAAIALPGTLTGALLANNLSHDVMRIITGIIIIFVTVTLIAPSPKENPPSPDIDQSSLDRPLVTAPLLFLIGLYGGFIQAGVGFLIMFFFHRIKGYTLLKTNAMKTGLITCYSLPAVLIFALTGRINWPFAVALAAGSWTGAALSSHLSIRKGTRIIRPVLTAALILLALRTFFAG